MRHESTQGMKHVRQKSIRHETRVARVYVGQVAREAQEHIGHEARVAREHEGNVI